MDRERRQSGERSWQDETPPKMYSILKGTVASVQAYGAFIRFPGRKKNGLVHKSQISNVPVDKPEEVLEVGEEVHVKVISNENGKIALSMKVVSQTTGEDMDPNHIQASLDEQRRRTGFKKEIQKIELGAVLNTTCKKCGGKGHFAKDCYQTLGSTVTYDLVPDIDYLVEQEREKAGAGGSAASGSKKKKKEKKHKKKKKHKRKSEGTDDDDDEPKAKIHKKRHKKHRSRKDTSSSSSGADSESSDDEKRRRKKSEKRKSKSSR